MDEFDEERDEQLIKEREEYEEMFFSNVVDDMLSVEAMDRLIAQRLKYIDEHFDFEPTPEYETLQEIFLHDSEIPLDYDYTPNFDEVEYDFIIDGVFDEMDPQEEKYYKKLIDEYIEDEQHYFNGVLAETIQEQQMFEKAIDELIFEHIDEEYEQMCFEYYFEDYWYDEDEYNIPPWPYEDESVKDPFDSLGDIDYPEGEPQHVYRDEPDIRQELDRDLMLYELKIQRQLEMEESQQIDNDYERLVIDNEPDITDVEIIEPLNDIDDLRDEELIKNYQPLDEVIKDYFTRDDTLDRIIKERLKERKFRKIKQ